MIRKLLKFAICALVIAFSAQASSQALRVGSVADSRFQDDWTLDGIEMVNTRAKLLNPANFGPGGTVPRSIAITDTAATVGSVDAALLANFDVFFIGYLDDANPNAFTGAELAAMQTWVNAGGTMVVTCDDNNYDAVCAFFGHPATSGNPGVNPTVPTAAGVASQIFNGSFGVVSAVNEEGTQGGFTSTTGATILAHDSSGSQLPVVLIQNIGAGKVVFMADVDLIANAATSGAAITSPNDKFLGNVFAFIAGFGPGPARSVIVPTLSPASLVLLAFGLLAGLAIVRRRQSKNA